ncbi:DUF4402 domain-containing protein [Bdellovibrio bacteriovorus]|uniref:DUF4402 domain-containing protein n=1 Tax=Bdellovibrio bacteriovorus TaxID=959 RepID=UPI003AA8872B
MKVNALVAGSLVVLSLVSVNANAETGTAEALMKVVKGLSVATNSNLIFDEAISGAAAETVPHGSSEDDKNASFMITGEANRNITVNLPGNGLVVMTNGGATADDQIPVNSFTSNNPTALDGNGNAELFVGATRDALTPTQNGGDYATTFDVEVIY